MLEPTACRFWQATLQSGLADAKALQPCWDAIAREKRVPDHIDRRLARSAVQNGVLTVWQAQQLMAGRSTGFKIDRYVLLELIGQGGMGRVYLARDTRLNRRVALKILSPERVNNPRAIARFRREAMVGAQLQHENLVRIYDEGESSGRCYLVMEYIEGKNIGQMLAESGPVPPALAAKLASQVASGLEHAQRKGLIHRDVNPYNILVTRDGTAKLTDLGLAIDLAESDRVTRDGATVGTFDYVSPEQARHSHSVDTRSDIYSLGCTLYHMLSGQVPFPSSSLPEKLFGHQASEPEPLQNIAPWVPEGLAAVVSRSMRKSPDDRYSTPVDMAQALEPFTDEYAPVPALAETGPMPRVSSSHSAGEAMVTRQFTPPPADFLKGLNLGKDANRSPQNGAIAAEIDTGLPSPLPAAIATKVATPRPSTQTPPTSAAAVATPPSTVDPTPAEETRGPGDSFESVPGTPEKPNGLGIDLNAPATTPRPAVAVKASATQTSQPASELPPTTPAKKPAAERPILAPTQGGPLDLGINFDSPVPRASASKTPSAPAKKSATEPLKDPFPHSAAKAQPPTEVAPKTQNETVPAAAQAGDDPLGLGINFTAPTSAKTTARKPAVDSSPPPSTVNPDPVSVEPPSTSGTGGNGLFDLNLAHEPSISSGSSKPRVKPKTRAKTESKAEPARKPAKAAGIGQNLPRWLIPAAVGGLAVVLAGGYFVYQKLAGVPVAQSPTKGKGGGGTNPRAAQSKGGTSDSSSIQTPGVAKLRAQPNLPTPQGKEVAVVAADGTTTIEADLKSAIRAAVGSRGYVLLQNTTPMKFTAAEHVAASGGTLVLRAAPGTKPVLKVEVKGATPFLSTRTDSPLKIEGVTFEATYVDPGNDPAPVIEAGGAVTLDRCSFRLAAPSPKSRALAVEGGSLAVAGCWFENFDRALDIACFGGMTSTLRECMIVRTAKDAAKPAEAGAAPAPTPAPASSGWAVRLRSMPGGFAKTGRRLVMEHCTSSNPGFLDLAGFSPEAPINIQATSCAVVADTLVAWEPGTTADPRTKDASTINRFALSWTGRDNQYDIRGTTGWVQLIPSRNAPPVPLPDGPNDLASWTKLLAAESDTVPPPVKFATESSSLSERPEPTDYAIPDKGIRPIGANPKFVGPGAEPVPPSSPKPLTSLPLSPVRLDPSGDFVDNPAP